MHEYLSPGRFIDSDHPSVVEFAEKHRGSSRDPLEQAIKLSNCRCCWVRCSAI
ncbi:transglutaminase-like putative cysteine protease [Pseudomonas lini]|nr:transglutaminase-like putative cysteine protease [Pseudomonas lini]